MACPVRKADEALSAVSGFVSAPQLLWESSLPAVNLPAASVLGAEVSGERGVWVLVFWRPRQSRLASALVDTQKPLEGQAVSCHQNPGQESFRFSGFDSDIDKRVGASERPVVRG